MPRGPKPGVQRGEYKRISLEVKGRLVQAVEEGEDYVSVARTLGVKAPTARSILLRYEDEGRLDDSRGGRLQQCVKMTDVVERIVQYVEHQPDITLKSISEKLAATEPPVHVSVTSIARALDGQLITTKKLQDCPAHRNSPRVKADRVVYAQWYLQHINDVHVYVDETCFNLFTHRTRGRSKRGEPAFRQLRFERGRN